MELIGVNKIKVALVTHLLSSDGGGVTQVVNDLAVMLKGHMEIKVFGLEGLNSEASFSGPVKFGRLGYDSRLVDRIRHWEPCLIHLHGLFTFVSLSALRVSIAAHVPLIVSPHGMLDSWALDNSKIKKRLFWYFVERRVLSAAIRVHALNIKEEGSIRDLLGSRPIIRCIPNGVDHFPVSTIKIGCEQFRLLYLGRIHPKKGLAELLLALKLCSRQHPFLLSNLEVNIVGWGDASYVAQMKRMASDLGLDGFVFFRGPAFGVSKDEFFTSSDAFILPSYSEGLPMAVLEAWSFGLPVLITPECNLEDGFLCGAAIKIQNVPQSLASSLIELLETSRDELQQMGKRGRNLVATKYSWDSVAKQYLSMYEEVLVEHEAKKLSKSRI